MRGAYGLPYNTKYATFQSQRKGLMVATKFAGFAMFNLAFLSVSYTRLGVQLKGAIWASIIAYCILDGFLGASVDWLAAWFSSLGGSFTTYLSSTALNWAHSIKTWFTGPFDDPVIELTNFVQGALTYATQAALEQAELLAINPDVFAMGTGGTVYDYDLRINGSPTCAEGGGGGLQPLIAGDIVALNVCTGNPKQFWKGYNTEDCAESIWRDCWDGGDLIYFQVTLDGLCLSPVNETVNTPQRMILAWCDGSAAQLWRT